MLAIAIVYRHKCIADYRINGNKKIHSTSEAMAYILVCHFFGPPEPGKGNFLL
jgi:hypothetical protein